jgi:hypothetical protein
LMLSAMYYEMSHPHRCGGCSAMEVLSTVRMT